MGTLFQNGGSYKLFLLPAYVLFETTRATLTYAAIQSGVSISSTFVTLCSELSKAVFTTAFLLNHISKEYGSISIGNFLSEIHSILLEDETKVKPVSYIRSYIKYMIPSFLYLVNNILYLVALKLTTPALLHIAILAKLPLTAVAHHFLLQPQRNTLTWLSLAVLCIGLLVTNIPPGFGNWLFNGFSNGNSAFSLDDGSFPGIVVGLIMAATSGYTSIYMEMVMKQQVPFWVAQFWLYTFGSVFAAVAYGIWDGHSHRLDEKVLPNDESTPFIQTITVAAVVATTAATGLCVANILRKKDNLVKLVGTSASIVTIVFAQTVLFPQLRKRTFTVQTVIGIGVISTSTWTYNYYKQLDSSEKANGTSLHLRSIDDDDPIVETFNKTVSHVAKNEDDGGIAPTPRRLLAVVILIACLAACTAGFGLNVDNFPVKQQQQQEPRPDTKPISLLYTTNEGVDDLARFFVPHNITPATWGQTNSSITCIEDWIKKYAEPNSNNFTNWETAFVDSKCPMYPIPKGGMIFHQFWRGPWRAFNEISIEAWLATQRLGDGHRLIYWYEGNGPTEEVRKKFTEGEYGKYVEFREFDATNEPQGYCVENMPEWDNITYLKANGMNVASFSDIVRNFLLAKYGGVWLDSDTIVVRDLTPMLRSGPSAPALETTKWNNNLLVFGPPDTNVTRRVLEATCSFSANETIYKERHGSDNIPSAWYWLWNDGLFKSCVTHFNCGISRIPAYYTDGYCWLWGNQAGMLPCEPGEDYYQPGGEPIPLTMRTLFSWHARFGQYNDACVDIERPTIAGAVRRRIRELLDLGLDMEGRDLFPGPGYTS